MFSKKQLLADLAYRRKDREFLVRTIKEVEDEKVREALLVLFGYMERY